MSYAVTPTSSVEASQDSCTRLRETAVAVRFCGWDGGVVSVAAPFAGMLPESTVVPEVVMNW